ncbi:MAG: undecaprenyl-phosphate glucose phosphotransferase [Bacteroidales bacterium]
MKARRYSNYFKPLLMIWDILCICVAYMLSLYFRYNSFEHIRNLEAQVLLLFSIVFWIILVKKYEAHKLIRIRYRENFISKSIRVILLHALLLLALVVILKYDYISRLHILYFYIVLFTIILTSRMVGILILEHLRARGINYRTIAIVGMNRVGKNMVTYLQKDLSLGYYIIGYFDDKPSDINNIQLLGNVSEVRDYIRSHIVDELFIASLDYDSTTIKQIIEECEQNFTRVKIIPEFQKYTHNRQVNIDFYGTIPIVFLRKEPLENSTNRLLKRSFDVVFSLVFFLVIAPWLFPIIMTLVAVSSRGPLFFSQLRSGENNTSFKCYKFRTMFVNDSSDEQQATRNDSRITPVGKWLRKFNLDELPQFYNVLRGDMSVVGPRPHMIKHTEEYSSRIQHYLVRHFVKPGLTGWAQVNGYRGETKKDADMQNRIEYDIWYIEHWSFLFDVRIIFQTLTNMCKGEKNAV